MQYDDIINILLEKFPELSSRYEEDKDYLEDLPHLVFENILTPYLIELVEYGNEKHKLIQIFNFLEEMIICSDEKVQEVAVVSVLETLLPEREILEKIQTYFGKKSREYLDQLEKSYGWKS